MTPDNWLEKLAHLNVDRAKGGPAPHKPLLLLVVLELAELCELSGRTLLLTPELSFRFSTFWRVVTHRRTQRPDVRLPFHHLGSDGVWIPRTESGEQSKHRQFTTHVEFDTAFFELVHDSQFRKRARYILIATYFEPAERNSLYQLFNMRVPRQDEIARDAHYKSPQDATDVAREARFRLDIVSAYNYTCALTGYRVTTISSGSIVDAAHIHQFSSSRNNNPQNGMALCKNAHWLFDVGVWSLGDDYRIIVATRHFSETCPDQKSLGEYHGQRIRLPERRELWPDPKHLAWHRKHQFLGV